MPVIIRWAALAAAVVVMAPAVAFAQASIVGVVRDTSGAVLPGVTVEAASPALIEKVRAVVTDGTGQYRIENLRPGVYSLTFALAGFNTVKREGIELSGSFTASINADMRVGALEETITVTGEALTVDTRSATRQRVVDREVIDSLPSGRTVQSLAALIPGVTTTLASDVGGAKVDANAALSVHGSRSGDQQWLQSGMKVTSSAGSGHTSRLAVNMATIQEVTVDYSAGSAEMGGGGVRINFIPREGTNTFNGTSFFGFANRAMQGDNLTPELQARGLRTPDSLEKLWDVNVGFGGPLKRDKVWFYVSPRFHGGETGVSGMFHNLNANNPNAWTYEPDLNRPAVNVSDFRTGDLRLTYQVTPRNKLGVSMSYQSNCSCPGVITATQAPEAVSNEKWPAHTRNLFEWTSPVTSRFLLEAGGVLYSGPSFRDPYEGLTSAMITVRDQATGLQYRSHDAFRSGPIKNFHKKLIGSYITGAHTFKAGVDHSSGYQGQRDNDNGQPLSYRFNNGVPNQITMRAWPYEYTLNQQWFGAFVQDRWTIDRLTLNYGVRYDFFGVDFPEERLGPTLLTPNRSFTFEAQESIDWHDITPKFGAAYDLFGNGRTAVKVSLSKYVSNHGGNNAIVRNPNPLLSVVHTTNRSWNDLNRNYVPDCDILNPNANGECGALANRNFGNPVPGAVYDRDLMTGWGKREYNWEGSAGIQHELLPRVSIDVGYFRRWFGNFVASDNRAVSASDYNVFSVTAPADQRLPNDGGYTVSGLYNLNPSKFGVPDDTLFTRASNYGEQTEMWQGVDVSLNGRPRQGLMFQGGFSTGRTVTDNCEIVAALPEMLISGSTLTPAQFCHGDTGFQTQAKASAAYTVPRIDVLVSATLQSSPGTAVAANYVATNAVVAPSLGRPLSGGAANVTANLVQAGELFTDRISQVDFRVAKVLRVGRTRASLNVDLYNALNANPVLTENFSYAVWRQPTSILMARFAKLTLQFDF